MNGLATSRVFAEINAEPGNEFIRFNNGRVLHPGEESGGLREDIWRTQIKHTIKKHLDKELQVRGRGIKVLSLFFVDHVANYRDYDEAGHPVDGKFARAFEEEFSSLAKEERYQEIDWLKYPMDKLHDGYFAQDKKGVFKDTRGDSEADDTVYDLIMKNRCASFLAIPPSGKDGIILTFSKFARLMKPEAR